MSELAIKEFGDFPVVVKRSFVGPKVSTTELHESGKPVIVEFYEIGDSTKKIGTLCTTIQIIFEEKKRVIFTSSIWLRDALSQMKDDCFPFRAIIVKINDHLEFKRVKT